ncbi:MtnX-like HAD-IB family phosphatase [Herbivorax sp. ANBcel31]|uniref:MtnX-like HAD-IB family phosphatase n=1 Tax=Herbivorax sp. ANBcel31 TaxID=3069754 RepID=UPI0027B0E031|nr:MtnX-like HAD-IB family phosphatase [Herbivorax sp. ANBcel31]MDQ2085208.1 MtnX-like HAD-IB family phosphatase [Herbivorax sp. ANBcel31]
MIELNIILKKVVLMKNFAFVSDFDGTISLKDFYHIIIDKYLGDEGKNFYQDWKKTKKINVEFLNKIFSSIKLDEKELHKEIFKIPVDKNAIKLIEEVKKRDGDFYILSAGTSYYIKILLDYLNINDIEIISMKGIYINGGIKIIPNEDSLYYSSIFGIDKGKVIEDLKSSYKEVFFAGDSEPDFQAAKKADLAFGKSELKDILKKEDISFIPFRDFSEIINHMEERGWF